MRSPVRLSELSSSPQAIMMSICLQSMVDELMVKKSGGSIRKVNGTRDPAAAAWFCALLLCSGREGSGWALRSLPAFISTWVCPQMLRRRVGGPLRRSDSQQAVKSPPLLVSGRQSAPWLPALPGLPSAPHLTALPPFSPGVARCQPGVHGQTLSEFRVVRFDYRGSRAAAP